MGRLSKHVLRALSLGAFAGICMAVQAESLPSRQLEQDYPGISRQIARISRSVPDLSSERTIRRLERYTASPDPELKKAMGLVLAEDESKLLDSVQITVDGSDEDWRSVPFLAVDPEGDATADILEQKVFLDEAENLYITMKPALRNGSIPPEFIFQPLVRVNGESASFLKILCVKGRMYLSDRSASGKDTPMEMEGAEFKTGRVYEIKVPLAAWLKSKGGAGTLDVWTGYFDGDKYDGISQPIPLLQSNHALLLLLDLLDEQTPETHDPIAAAAAIANSTLYALGDAETKQQVREDQRRQLALYRKINAWQKTRNLPYRLDQLPAIPKILWASRYNRHHLNLAREAMRLLSQKRLSREIYMEFFDRPELLERIHDEIVTKSVPVSADIQATAAAIERHASSLCETRFALWKYEDLYKRGMMRKEDYERIAAEAREGYEIEYMGKKRNWEEFRWNNYQFQNKCFRGKKILGDCGTYTQAMTALYRMAGISVITNQRVNKEATFAYPSTHNFPAYYHPFLRRWIYVQVPAESGANFNPNRPVSLHVDLAVTNSLLFDDQKTAFGNDSSAASHIHFLSMGLSEKRLEEFFISRDMRLALLDSQSAPEAVPQDTDADGIVDTVERELGTAPERPDTDADGAADLAELNNGRDPLVKDAPGPSIDGWLADAEMQEPVTIEDPSRDIDSPAADIVRVHIAMREGTLHLVVETAGRPRAGIIFQPLIVVNDETSWSIKALDSGPFKELERREGETRTPVESAGFLSARGSVYEMQIPLADVRPEALHRLRVIVYLFTDKANDSAVLTIVQNQGHWVQAPLSRDMQTETARPPAPCTSPSEDSCVESVLRH